MLPNVAQTAIATRTTVELLRFYPESHRAGVLFSALRTAAAFSGIDLTTTDRYRGDADWLLVWGPGDKQRVEPMARHLAAGGHVISFDCSYWSRQQKLRVSIDAPHPQAWVMQREFSRARFLSDPVPFESAWKPNGPVVIAGIGRKANLQYGQAVDAWEASMIAACRQRGLKIRYREKKQGPVPAGLASSGTGPIEPILRGASLVITWHSNVAVDAIRMGIPVICQDGAAAAVCASDWPHDGMPEPLPASVRDQFMWNLAHFQWGTTPVEARGCWSFLQELVCGS